MNVQRSPANVFFESGVRPTGLVSEPVIQSWSRCVGSHREPGEHVAFDPVTKSRIASTLARNRQLLAAAQDDLSQLSAALAGTSCKAILASHDGVVVHATPTARGGNSLMQLITRVGVNLGETAIGTGAPALAAATGEVCTVLGAEHFFAEISMIYCVAAPIRDARGDIAAVLDISSEGEMFRFDAAALARVYAGGIENRLLEAQSGECVLLRYQTSPGLLHTALEGLAAVAGDGRVVWINASGASLLGCDRMLSWNAVVEALFGLDVEALLSLAHGGKALPLRVPSGLTIWMEARLPDGVQAAAAVPAITAIEPPTPSVPETAVGDAEDARLKAPVTLEDTSRAVIERTLSECKGNVSRAARRLGVSRGLLYRRLAEWGKETATAPGPSAPPL